MTKEIRSVVRTLTSEFREEMQMRHVSEVLHFDALSTNAEVPVLTVKGVDRLGQLLQLAAKMEFRVLPLGSGHSCRHFRSERPIVCVKLGQDPDPVRQSPDSKCDVFAGLTWLALSQIAAAKGLQPHVVTDYQLISIAGSLSRGGFGVDSIRHGSQSAHVTQIELLLPDGTCLKCGRDHWLFTNSLAAGFPTGILLRTELPLQPLRRDIRLLTYQPTNLDDFVGHLSELSWAEEDAIQTTDFVWFPNQGPATYQIGLESTREDIPAALKRSAVCDDRIRAEDRTELHREIAQWFEPFRMQKKVWLDYVVSLKHAAAFARLVSAFCDRAGKRWPLECMLSVPISSQPSASDLSFAADAGEFSRYFLFGLYFMPIRDCEEARALIELARRELLVACHQCQGRPYRHGNHCLTGADYKAFYGSSAQSVVDKMKLEDPHEVFAPWTALQTSLADGSEETIFD